MANEESQFAPGSRPVGSQLQKAREAKNLSVAEVADAQHLRPAIINAIENGQYEQIDTELFLKGYIRAYARQVGLDGSALIADLDAELEPMRKKQAQAKAANPLVDIERRRHKKRRIAKALLWLIALAALGFLAFSFVYNPARLADLPDASARAVNNSTTESSAVSGVDENTRSDDLELLPNTAEGTPEPLAVKDNDKPVVVNEAISADGGVFPPSGTTLQSTPRPAQTAIAGDNDSATRNAPQALQTESNRGRLEIEFANDCWIQVRDAGGRTLASGLKRKNDRVDLRAESNLRLVIGAANAIEYIRFQGAPVDLDSKRIVGNRAEFVLALNE